MTECVYCNEAIKNESPAYIGGEPFHGVCARTHAEYMDHLDVMAEEVAAEYEFERHLLALEAEGELYAAQYDEVFGW